MSTEAAAPLPDTIDELKKRREAADLRSQIAALTAPWWRKASLLTLATGLIAAVLPVTTAVEQHYKTQREYLLQQAKQDNDIRIAYLDRYQLPGHRRQTLRFLAATSSDPRLVEWARSELPVVQAELDDIDTRLAAREKELPQPPPGKTREELQKEIAELKRLKDASSIMAATAPAPPNVLVPAGYTMPANLFVPIPARVEPKQP